MEERKSRKGDVRETKIVGEREVVGEWWRENRRKIMGMFGQGWFSVSKVVKLNLSIIKFVSFIFILFILAFSL